MTEFLAAAVLFLSALPPLAWLLLGATRFVDGLAPLGVERKPSAPLTFPRAMLAAGCGAAAFVGACAAVPFGASLAAIPAFWITQAVALALLQPTSFPRAATASGMATFAALVLAWLAVRIAEGLVSVGVG